MVYNYNNPQFDEKVHGVKKNNKAISSELRRWAARLQRISEHVIGCGPRPGVRKNHGIEAPLDG